MSDQPTDPTQPESEPTQPPAGPPSWTPPPSTPPTPEAQPQTWGMQPPVPPSPPTMTTDAPPPPPPARPAMGRYVIGALVVALGAGAAWIATRGGSDATVLAGSPTQAVDNMIKIVGEGRIVDLIRGEFPWIAELGAIDEAALSAGGLPEGRISGITLAGDNLTYEVEEVGSELAIVTITDGSLTVGLDSSQLPPALAAAVPGGLPPTKVEQTLEIPAITASMCATYDVPGQSCPGISLVTVNEGGEWRVSWMHTFFHLSGQGTLQPREANGASSPEDLEDRIETAIDANDPNRFFDLLDPHEFSWLSDFELDMDSEGDPPSLDLMFEVLEETATDARLKLAGFDLRTIELAGSFDPDTFEFSTSDEEVLTTFDGDCVSRADRDPVCLSDLASKDLGPFESALRPLFDLLANDGIMFGAVNRDGLWYLSVKETLEPYAPALQSAAQELQSVLETCRSAFQGLSDPGAFSGGTDPFADIPEECQAFMGLFMGGLGGFGSDFSSDTEFLDDGGYTAPGT